jgi:predicted nucleic acid-binding protein
VLTLDTSAVIALLDATEPFHRDVREVVEADSGPYLVPAGALSEIAYMLRKRLGDPAVDLFVDDLVSGDYRLDCDESDFARIGELMNRYRSLRLDFVDASVIASAERNGCSLVSIDRRDLDVVSREGGITVLPTHA